MQRPNSWDIKLSTNKDPERAENKDATIRVIKECEKLRRHIIYTSRNQFLMEADRISNLITER